MKKIILLIFVSFLSITSFAQIQRKIFRCTLGTSTYNQVERILMANYENPWFDGSRTILGFDNIEYGGYYWNKVVFKFHKKILYSVTLEGSNYVTSRNCKNDFLVLERDLKNRYSKYRTLEGYDDGTIEIKTSFFQNNDHNYQSATISYEFKPFTKKKQAENKRAW